MPDASSLAQLAQPGVLLPITPVGAALVFDIDPDVDPRPGVTAIRAEPADGNVVIGIGDLRALKVR